MKILLIGNLGYLGPVVSAHLKSKSKLLFVGLDTVFFTIKTISNTLLSIDKNHKIYR